jgi:DNA-binding NarL/FixJ family response regulator
MSETRILIVDDHEIVRERVRSLLKTLRPAWEICGEATTGAAALVAIPRLRPDIVIMDITMPEMSGFQAASQLRERGDPTRIVFFTMHDSESLSSDVRGAGGQGFVLKSQAAQKLIQAIETIRGGGTFFGTPQAGSKEESDPSVLGILFWRQGFSPA